MKRATVLGVAIAAAALTALATHLVHEPWSAQRFSIFGPLRSGGLAVLQALQSLVQGLGASQ
ncbi:hypothetical protein [Pseudomonas sp. TCU-HL1]|uniref:hypothetical protein n=1 Tax=Pseudomonas sp. TCU-HL1 TaxID=1856685 RepID=UPI00083E595C|nr:hypothetical protein [Pseudomonas sp. TCU-HL1]AOE86017.1 hypothetical protein THL1_3469 [Pseudomonas sp. TCU-HL1]